MPELRFIRVTEKMRKKAEDDFILNLLACPACGDDQIIHEWFVVDTKQGSIEEPGAVVDCDRSHESGYLPDFVNSHSIQNPATAAEFKDEVEKIISDIYVPDEGWQHALRVAADAWDAEADELEQQARQLDALPRTQSARRARSSQLYADAAKLRDIADRGPAS